MKTINSVLEKQIGFFSFLLAFIVFYSGSVRGLLASDLSSPEVVHLTQSSKDQSDLHQQQATIFNAISEVETVESEIDEVLVSLVDLPGLTSAAVARVVNSPGEIVVACYDGKRGHPVKFARATWPELATSATGDQGARSFIANHPEEIVLVEVGDIATGEDMDERPS